MKYAAALIPLLLSAQAAYAGGTTFPPAGAGSHWAFLPISRSAVPDVSSLGWARNAIDRFTLARLKKENLSPSAEADKRTLIRRLHFIVTGLPPDPDEVSAFLADSRENAYEVLVDKLLASPRYGERWARHWLDVVRFAESNGFEMNNERPRAWPYRDYVVRVFNEDRPYDRFVLEQLAGDTMGIDEATGFLVGGPYDAVKSPDISLTLQQRMDELHDIISTTSSAFLGLTVGCARCHNHKFDPISQKDYYAMQAIFAGVQHGERPLRTPEYKARLKKAESVRAEIAGIEKQLLAYVAMAQIGGPVGRVPVNPLLNIEKFKSINAKFVRFTILETNGSEPCIDELEVYSAEEPERNVALEKQTIPTASGTFPNSELHKLEHINDGKTGNSRSWISSEPGKGWVQLEFPRAELIDRVVWARDREGKFKDRLAINYKIETALKSNEWTLVASSDDRAPYSADAKPLPPYSAASSGSEHLEELLTAKAKAETELKTLTSAFMIYAGHFEQPGPTYRLNRGEAMQPREQVSPGMIGTLGTANELSADSPERERRLALANWIVDRRNPLTARVLVNRLWHYNFGQGIVSTPSDFGHMGTPPTNPELLDWLASEFVESGWSIKHVQRLILLSATFRQSSAPNVDALKIDGDSRLHWRFPPRRLEAEALRDAILAVSGNLVLRMGGPGFDLFEPNSNYVKVYNPKTNFVTAEWRRMIYQSKPRMRVDDTFGIFDCPDGGQVAPRRNVSTTPLQALSLLNSPFVLEESKLFAARLESEAGKSTLEQVRRAFLLAFGRLPFGNEEDAAIKFADEQGLTVFCRALFNANDFLYVF